MPRLGACSPRRAGGSCTLGNSKSGDSVTAVFKRATPGPGHYEVDSQQSHISTRVGFGLAHVLPSGNAVPGPGSYDVAPASTPRLSRARSASPCARMKHRNEPEIVSTSPGPAAYSPEMPTGRIGGWLTGAKHRLSSPGVTAKLTPGPGDYEPESRRAHVPTIVGLGSAHVLPNGNAHPGPGSYDVTSAPASARARTVSPRKAWKHRDEPEIMLSPGPGAYSPLTPRVNPGSANFGYVTSSTHRASRCRLPHKVTPGPGDYEQDKLHPHVQTSAAFGAGHVLPGGNAVPGPGTYDAELTLSQASARNRSRSLGRKTKHRDEPDIISQSPGPAAYSPSVLKTNVGGSNFGSTTTSTHRWSACSVPYDGQFVAFGNNHYLHSGDQTVATLASGHDSPNATENGSELLLSSATLALARSVSPSVRFSRRNQIPVVSNITGHSTHFPEGHIAGSIVPELTEITTVAASKPESRWLTSERTSMAVPGASEPNSCEGNPAEFATGCATRSTDRMSAVGPLENEITNYTGEEYFSPDVQTDPNSGSGKSCSRTSLLRNSRTRSSDLRPRASAQARRDSQAQATGGIGSNRSSTKPLEMLTEFSGTAHADALDEHSILVKMQANATEDQGRHGFNMTSTLADRNSKGASRQHDGIKTTTFGPGACQSGGIPHSRGGSNFGTKTSSTHRMSKLEKQSAPGPGSYGRGKRLTHIQTNAGFGTPHVLPEGNSYPGPGQYEPQASTLNVGSVSQNAPIRSKSQSRKMSTGPGPGAYSPHSQVESGVGARFGSKTSSTHRMSVLSTPRRFAGTAARQGG